MTKPQSPHIRNVRAGKKMANAYAKQFGIKNERPVSMATKAKRKCGCCNGTGVHPEDGITPCPKCGGNGLCRETKVPARGRKREGSKP